MTKSQHHTLRLRWIAWLTLAGCLAAPLQANPFMGTEPASDATGTVVDGGSSRAGTPAIRARPANESLVTRQGTLREALGTYLSDWKRTLSPAVLWAALGAAFAYGVLHALGPGHRKTVVFSLYLARGAPAWEPALAGLALALLHALSAVVVLILLSGVSGAVTGRTDRVAQYLEGFAYLALIIVAVYLVAEATHDLIAGKSRHANAARSVGALLITGIYPCPGAILVMVLALALDIKAVGAAAVLAMSLGMSLPIVAAGYLAWFGRAGLFSALKRREAAVARAAAAVELTGYLLLLAFAAYMAYPFAVGLLG